jgi:hypothetical protein
MKDLCFYYFSSVFHVALLFCSYGHPYLEDFVKFYTAQLELTNIK